MECTIFPHGDALSAGVVVLGDDASCLFVVAANKIRCDRACPEPVEGSMVWATRLPSCASGSCHAEGGHRVLGYMNCPSYL
jgi:hypothetical protein